MSRGLLISSTVAATLVLLGAASGSLATASKLPGLDASGIGKPRVRPAQVNFGGDGSFYITRMKWSQWAADTAVGNGTGHVNDCKPYCAAGHFHRYAVSVQISRPKLCRDRAREFTRLTVRFVGRKPTNAPRRVRYHAGLGCP